MGLRASRWPEGWLPHAQAPQVRAKAVRGLAATVKGGFGYQQALLRRPAVLQSVKRALRVSSSTGGRRFWCTFPGGRSGAALDRSSIATPTGMSGCCPSGSVGVQDASPAVRQQAVDLLGGSIGEDASLALAYFDTLELSSADTATSVRKVWPRALSRCVRACAARHS